MESILQQSRDQIVSNAAKALKTDKVLTEPDWAQFIKTGTHKARPPHEGWFYERAASLLLKIYFRGPIGVNKLRTLYGGKKRRGHKPAEFRKASGFVIRKILQDFEKLKYIEQVTRDGHKGRIVTSEGVKFLAKVSKPAK